MAIPNVQRTYVPRIPTRPRHPPRRRQTPLPVRLDLNRRDYYCVDAEYLNQHINSGAESCYYCEQYLYYDPHSDWYYAARHIIEEHPFQ